MAFSTLRDQLFEPLRKLSVTQSLKLELVVNLVPRVEPIKEQKQAKKEEEVKVHHVKSRLATKAKSLK